jgi:hypothetical protein
MSMSGRVIVNLGGWQRIKNALRRLTRTGVEVGYFEDEQAGKAAVHEFGSARTPARPTLTPTLERHAALHTRQLAQAAVLQAAGNPGVTEAYAQVGRHAVDAVGAAIDTLDTPPLAASTVARKGHAKPLIDTGAMRRALTFRVVGLGAAATQGEGGDT